MFLGPRGRTHLSVISVALLILSLSDDSYTQEQTVNFATDPDFVAEKFADIQRPRALILDSAGDVLVLSSNQIIAIQENKDDVVQHILVDESGLGLNHGIAINGRYLYASSATTVYRWPYVGGSRRKITAPREIVIRNIPYGGYVTRSIVFDTQNYLYVSIGARSNADYDENRSAIRVHKNISNIPVDFQNLEDFATGLRNTVGLGFDANGLLWGVDNGLNDIARVDLGPEIHRRNPADELNRFNVAKQFYGHPYCFTADKLVIKNSGQYAHPKFQHDGVHNDEWCWNKSTNVPPVFPLPAHNAPLGITFYNEANCKSVKASFPCSVLGDAFIAFHGSKNTDIPDGYFVGWLPFNKSTNEPTGEIRPVIYEANPFSCSPCFRPVDVIFDRNGHMLVSTDATNEIIRVRHRENDPGNTNGASTQNSQLNALFNTSVLLFFGKLFS